MRISIAFASLALAATASTADASLFVSGDSNIFGSSGAPLDGGTFAPNRQFLQNIAGASGIVVQDSGRTDLTDQADAVVGYYNGAGYSASLLGGGSVLSAADLAGKSLFIGYAPDDAYTAGEIAVLSSFLAGGGNVLLTGENSSFFADLNAILNAALPALGSSMLIANDNIDGGGFFAASIQAANAFTAGTDRLQYAFTSRVTGGVGLYGTQTGNQTFLAFEGAAVPEPASWAMMIAGFALAGVAARRRSRAFVTA